MLTYKKALKKRGTILEEMRKHTSPTLIKKKDKAATRKANKVKRAKRKQNR